MRKLTVMAALVWSGLLGLARGDGTDDAQSRSVVVLELFTSQGCSSCPPAEQVLGRLSQDERLRERIIPLAFHVDYWDELGWIDPFAARAWSLRQASYGRALGGRGSYTPQLVVNGRAEFTGGNEQRARAEIAADVARASAARLRLSTRKAAGERPGLVVEVAAELIESVPARKLQVLVALFENRLVTQVARGENGGRTLENEFVVRRLENAVSLDPKVGSRTGRTLELKLHRGWKLENVGVVAFVQDPATMRIYGATALRSLD
jgi:hypothetical protein